MLDDNIYKGTRAYNPLNMPEETKDAQEREKTTNEATIPAVESAVETLKVNIEQYNRLPAIPDDILNLDDRAAIAFRNQVAINKQTVANLMPILENLEDILQQYKR